MPTGVQKPPTGIGGLDDLTFEGLPTGRPTLLCGKADVESYRILG
jgi:circadian clock protein KaiC